VILPNVPDILKPQVPSFSECLLLIFKKKEKI
jgi:hypothetical protein